MCWGPIRLGTHETQPDPAMVICSHILSHFEPLPPMKEETSKLERTRQAREKRCMYVCMHYFFKVGFITSINTSIL